jgi:hypothetical protein
VTRGPKPMSPERKRLKNHFQDHKQNARERGVAFLLTFEEWLGIWIASDHLHERGPRRDQYCMARFNDAGAYEMGNVEIITSGENSRRARLTPFTPEAMAVFARIGKASKGRKPVRSQAHLDALHAGRDRYWDGHRGRPRK